MGKLALEGFWLLGGFAVVYLVGVFTAQWAKDKINGVPSSLRNAFNATEAATLKQMHSAREQVVIQYRDAVGPKDVGPKPDPVLTPAPDPAPAAPVATT